MTFVFTDIEGSTRLFHQLGQNYVQLIDRHNEILQESWRAWDGYEVSTEGDSFFVAFSEASKAVAACAEAQRALAAERWPEDVGVAVRMGVHTGIASLHDGNYVSLTVHQASRIMSAAHGGQVLVSEATGMELENTDDVRLIALGRFRLKDFDEPQTVYQLAGEGLEGTFPAVRAVPAEGHNIVRRSTPTVGRDQLVQSVSEHIQAGRLVTLLGPGGIGKTRVAEEVGVALSPDWADGVWLVNLAGVTNGDQVGVAVADAVGAANRPGRERDDDLVEHLRERRAVVILDDCEDLLEACGRQVRSLQASCPGVAVLATSREPLQLTGEVLWHVEPLRLPTSDAPTAAEVLDSPSGYLFAQRAEAARPDFAITDANAGVIAEICQRLDGLPLSIELAAALLSVQSPHEILRGLDDRFRLLRTRGPSASARHDSVVSLLDWSYESLSDHEKRAFRDLSVFSSGFSIETAAVVIGVIDDPRDAAPLVWSLAERSLVQSDLSADTTRYRLLDTMRSYGRDALDEAGETAEVAGRLADHYLATMGPDLPADRHWGKRVAQELDNVRGLIGMLPAERAEAAQQLIWILGRYQGDILHTYAEGIDELTRYVALVPDPTPTQVSLLTTLAFFHLRGRDLEAANALIDQAAAMREQVGVPDWDEVAVERARGEVARRSGDLEEAVAIAREALDRPLNDRSRSRMFNLLGTSAGALGDMETAEMAFVEELELSRSLGYESYVASSLGNLAEVAMRQGDYEAAASYQKQCLEQAVALGSVTVLAFSMIVAARLAGHHENWSDAVKLHAHGEKLLAETGLVLYEDDRSQSDELLDRVREQLGDTDYEAAATAGREMDLNEAIEATRSQLDALPHLGSVG